MPYSYFSSDETCLVFDRQTGHLHALKTFTLNDKIGLPSLNEIDVLTRFRHPSLLGFSQLFRLDLKCLGLILPIGRWTLDNIIDEESLWTRNDRIRVLWQLANGVAFLHQHQINHNNLSLSDIIVRRNEDNLDVVIADFSEASSSTQRGTKDDLRKLGIIFLQMMTQQKDVDEKDVDEEALRLSYLQSLIKDPNILGLVDLVFLMVDPGSTITSQDVVKSSFFKYHGFVTPIIGIDLEANERNAWKEEKTNERNSSNEEDNHTLSAIFIGDENNGSQRKNLFFDREQSHQIEKVYHRLFPMLRTSFDCHDFDRLWQKASYVYTKYFQPDDIFLVVFFIVYKMSYRVDDTTTKRLKRNLVDESRLSDDLFLQLELDYVANFVDSRSKV